MIATPHKTYQVTAIRLCFLTEEACDEIQGYLVGRPAPIDLYADLVGRRHMSKISAIAG